MNKLRSVDSKTRLFCSGKDTMSQLGLGFKNAYEKGKICSVPERSLVT